MRKLVFTLLLFLASSPASADDVCISAISGPISRAVDRDYLRIVAPEPVYPPGALAKGSEGYVDVEFTVTTAGIVRDPIVASSVPPGLFDEAALEGALKFRYKPRIVDGAPVVVEGVQTRMTFSLRAPDRPEERKSAKRKKKVPQAVSKNVYDQIVRAQSMVDAEVYSSALSLLESLNRSGKLTEYERSNVLNYIGFIQYKMEDFVATIATYEELLRIPSLEEQIRKQTVYTLAQLNTMQKQYANSMRLLDKWFTLEPNPPAAPYILYAQNLYQVKRYRDMIKLIETAIQIAEKQKKPVKENWYTLLRYANSAINEFQNAVDISKEMNERWPSEENSYALAIIYAKLRDRDKALAALRELLASWPETDYLTPLHLAAAGGDTALVTELLANGADVNLLSRNDLTPLHSAGQFGQVETTEMLINAKADVNARTTTGFTALHLAAQEGFPLIAETLIAAGADVNAVTKSVGNTPLLLAIRGNHTAVVEMLILAGADVNARTTIGFTALHQAAQKGFPLIVEMLIAAGAGVNAVSNAETPPLLLAIRGNHTAVVEMLILAGADVNAKNKANLTVLHKAAENSEAPMVEMLIAAGAHVNARTESDRTPLHGAAIIGNAPVVEILIAAGADLDANAEDNWTPLSWAASYGHIALAKHLIDQGAKVEGVKIVAEAGFANAQFLLGSLYAQGHGVQQDDSLALRWYLAAAEQDNAGAAYALGEMYLEGRGIRTSAKKAAQWFQAAAHQGHRDAQMKLSELYRNGVGVKKDTAEASMWSCFAGATGGP
ncbi:MAG: TonB family protein [Proteobacteria bacterium]|nr:TonB family protein [Pseudomonadota bacterium]